MKRILRFMIFFGYFQFYFQWGQFIRFRSVVYLVCFGLGWFWVYGVCREENLFSIFSRGKLILIRDFRKCEVLWRGVYRYFWVLYFIEVIVLCQVCIGCGQFFIGIVRWFFIFLRFWDFISRILLVGIFFVYLCFYLRSGGVDVYEVFLD